MRKTDDGFCCSFNAINLADSFAKVIYIFRLRHNCENFIILLWQDENSTGDDFTNPYAYCNANTGSGSGNSYDSGSESNPAEEPDGSGDGADTGDEAGSGSNFYCQGMSSGGSETPDSNTGDENGDLSFSGLLAG